MERINQSDEPLLDTSKVKPEAALDIELVGPPPGVLIPEGAQSPASTQSIPVQLQEVRLSHDHVWPMPQQEPISFYERKAYVDDFRRKWRADKGLVSMFDKRHLYRAQRADYREAQNRVKSAVPTQVGIKKRNKRDAGSKKPVVHQQHAFRNMFFA